MSRFENLKLPHPDYPGLIAVGGKVTAAKMLAAYREGTFPWYNVGEPVMWWSPDPRAILEFGKFYISRRLARTIRSGKFRCTIDHDFAAVVRGCAEREEETWITPAMSAGFNELHRMGSAHSVEVWCCDELAGGIFGVAIGGFFSGESMFFRQRDASKVALAFLIDQLRAAGYSLFDIQILSPHTASLGAREVPRAEYLQRLKSALGHDIRFPAEPVRSQLSASGQQ